jgi:hypothetical protein
VTMVEKTYDVEKGCDKNLREGFIELLKDTVPSYEARAHETKDNQIW